MVASTALSRIWLDYHDRPLSDDFGRVAGKCRAGFDSECWSLPSTNQVPASGPCRVLETESTNRGRNCLKCLKATIIAVLAVSIIAPPFARPTGVVPKPAGLAEERAIKFHRRSRFAILVKPFLNAHDGLAGVTCSEN